MIIHTDRLILRHFNLDDAQEYFPLVSDPRVLKYTGEAPFTSLDQVRQMLLARPINDYSQFGFGRMACIEKMSGRLIGYSGLKFLSDLQEVDIGYRFIKDCWGKGYATESASAIMRQAVPEHQLKKVIGLTFPDNAASIHVLTKLGLQFEKKIKIDDLENELNYYSISYNYA